MRNKSIKSSHLVYLFYWFIKFIVGLVIDIIVTMYNITSHELNSVKISDSASDSHSVPRKKRSRSSSLPRVKKTRKRSSSLPSSSPHKKNRNRSSSLPPTSQQKKHESRLFTNDQKKKTNSNTAVHYGEYVCTDCNDTNIESRKNRFEHPRNYDVSKINKNIAAIQHIPETKLDPMQEYKKKIESESSLADYTKHEILYFKDPMMISYLMAIVRHFMEYDLLVSFKSGNEFICVGFKKIIYL